MLWLLFRNEDAYDKSFSKATMKFLPVLMIVAMYVALVVFDIQYETIMMSDTTKSTLKDCITIITLVMLLRDQLSVKPAIENNSQTTNS